jgi:cyclopropane-fatty-acyl-phospholipid synthase
MKYTPGEKGATLQHYDLEPEIFELFLDPYLKYSSGLYASEGMSLANAQLNKMEFIARQLALCGGEKVLDAGCGWGSLLFFLAERYSCRAHGVTPASQQADYLRRKASVSGFAQLVDATLGHIQDLQFPRETFDAITFVGSIVHMDDKRGVLEECYRLLKPGGRIYISETCFRNRQKYEDYSERPGTRFVRDDVFGWGSLVPFSVILAALEDANFSLTSLVDLTSHYRRTIEDWMGNIQTNRTPLDTIRPGIADKLLRLFETANAGWGFTTKHYAVAAVKRR